VCAYRVGEAGVPGVHALLEKRPFAPAGMDTRVQWTWAAEGTSLFRFLVGPTRAASPACPAAR
jgi:hypothetical protein